MRKFLLTFVAFFAMVSFALAQTISWKVADWSGVVEKAQTISLKSGDFTLTAEKGAGTTNPTVNEKTGDLRVYANGTLNIASAANMKQLVLNVSRKGQYRLAEITADAGQVTLDKSAEVWTLTWTGDANSVTFTVGPKAVNGTDGAAKSGQLCLDNIVVGEGGGEVTPNPQPEPQPENDVLFSADMATDAGGFVSYLGTDEWNWEIDTKYSCAKVTGHVGGKEGHKVPGVAYFVSPEISLANVDKATLSYTYAIGYMSMPEYHQVLINENFNESAPEEGWVKLETEHQFADKKFQWFDNTIELPASLKGKKIRIAFRYECNAEKASTWEVKNVKVAAAKGGDVKPEPQPENDVLFSADLAAEAGGFVNYLGTDEWAWAIDTKYSCAKVTGHVGGKEGHKVPGVAYFVSPEISLANVDEASLSYTYAIGYMSMPEYHQVMINENFNESAPEEGWVKLETEHQFADKKFQWFDNTIALPASLKGKTIRIAFRYECDAEKASTWEVKNVKVTGKTSTGIEAVETENGAQVIYDLSGRRVAKAVKGLYIINGKKVYVK